MSLPELQEPLALLEQKDFRAAVNVLEQKVTALPAHLGAHVLLAYAYEAQQRWDQALEAWENARFLMPNSPIAKEGKRRVLRRMDGIEGDGEPSSLADFPGFDSPLPGPPETRSEDEADEEEPMDAESSSAEEDFGLAQLRRQAEREARQGGARPGLTDTPSSSDLPSPPEEEEEASSTPEEQIEQLDEEDETDDLDRLIDELKSARIDPDPDAEADTPPPQPHDANEDDDTEEVVSETLARIHEGQHDYQKAAHIYAQLAEQEPDRADEFREKAAEMREKADGTDENP
jgi:tetratricopeptide (TPR) repeat protein